MTGTSLQAMLCECLATAGDRDAPDGAWVDALVDRDTDHLALARVAGRNLVTPALAEAVAAVADLERRLPAELAAHLRLIRTENRRRNRALRRQLGEVVRCLNAIGVEPVLLKGAIRLVDGLYPSPGWRFMRDLDLLVPQAHLNEAAAALTGAGYASHEPAGWPSEHQHIPPLTRDGDPAIVELHGELLPGMRAVCDATAVLARSLPLVFDGAHARLPAAVDQLAHLIAHDRCDGELCHAGRFLLRSALETALLCRDGTTAAETLHRFADAGLERWARAHLVQTARLFPGLVPTLPRPIAPRPFGERWRTAVELLGGRGRPRRFYWFGRHRLDALVHSAAAREQLAGRLRSTDFYRHCMRRLHEVWVDG